MHFALAKAMHMQLELEPWMRIQYIIDAIGVPLACADDVSASSRPGFQLALPLCARCHAARFQRYQLPTCAD